MAKFLTVEQLEHTVVWAVSLQFQTHQPKIGLKSLQRENFLDQQRFHFPCLSPNELKILPKKHVDLFLLVLGV
jgi:hypothetical protein